MSDIAPEEPATADRNGIYLPAVKTMYAVLHIEYMTLATQIVLCVYGLSRYKRAKASQNRRPYIVLSFLMLGLFAFASVTDSTYFAGMTINNPSRDLEKYLNAATPWYVVMGSVCNTIVILLGDGILVYRCYFIWHHRRWVIIIPSLVLTASFIMAILYQTIKINNAYFSAWIALSVAANTISTALIAGKLVYERRRLSKVLGHGHLAKYITATAILVESAVPLTLFGIASAIVLARTTDLPLVALFPSVWFCLSGLCPQLIIFRVAVGSSYPGDLDVKSEMLSRPIQFAQDRSVVETRSSFALNTGPSSSIPRETSAC